MTSSFDLNSISIAVLIPCYNEELAIGKVVNDFRTHLPGARIYVYDNNSTDNTREVAAAAGAIVNTEPQQGKGNVVRRMFSDIDADVYVLVDGDHTYEAKAAPKLVETLVMQSLDMVNARRIESADAAYRPGHRFGNKLLTGLVATIFGERIRDMLSGYRAFSKRFVKSFPALSRGFEIETELTVHALELRMPITEIDTDYAERLPGSTSKLNTIRDGVRIMTTISTLVKEERPIAFFSAITGVLLLISAVLTYPIAVEYFQTGLVPRFPTVILVSAMVVVALLSLVCGLILDTVTLGRREIKRLFYLSQPSLEAQSAALGARSPRMREPTPTS